MDRTLIKDSINKVGETVLLKGWVQTRRDHGMIVFLDLTDYTGLIQVVTTETKANIGDAVSIEGLIKSRPEKLVNPKIPTGGVEVEAKNTEVLGKSETYPFDMGKPELDLELPTLLDNRGLTLRHPKIQAIFKVQAVIIDAFRRALLEKGFLEFQAPGMIPTVPEGGTEVFEVKYFDHKVFLSQSPQLYKSLLVSSFERVFSVNQIYRAEPSVTTRHLTEATSLDAEFGFISSWLEVKDMAEYTIKFVLEAVASTCSKELELFGATMPKVGTLIPTLKLREAQEIISKRTGRDARKEKDLAPEDEREICQWSLEEKGSDLVFISHYPTKARPFYTYPDDENPEFNQGFDLMGRGTEWMTGGRRINDYETLVAHAKEWGVDPKKIELYLQGFRYGMPPLGGFAFGAERITMHILGLKNIREASMFPRDMERVDIHLSSTPTKADRDVFSEIQKLLDERKIQYQTFDHEPVFTSEQAAKVRGTELKQGAKALVMFGDAKPLMIVLPADRKVDTNSFKKLYGMSDLRMATKDEVKKLTNVEVGAVPPFGNIFNLPLYVDESLGENKEIAFNAGAHTKSIKMSYVDFAKVTKPTIGTFSS